MSDTGHDAQILDQFTRQAEPFIQRHQHSNVALLELMAECARPSREDTLLDIACGPGIVSCFFASRVRHVTGLDMVPAMLERAKRLQADKQLHNIKWKMGRATALPFPNNTFRCVVTRFSFHHYLAPQAALLEMKRVCAPGGTLVLADVAPSAEAQNSFNEWEILRDPSHVRALTQPEMEALGDRAGVKLLRKAAFDLVSELESLLAGSFPKPGDTDWIRTLFEEDILARTDRLGVSARREAGVIKVTYPVSVLAWQKQT